MAETRNVFISHVHKDDHGLQKLKDLLAPKGLDVRDSSIHTGKFNNATDEHYIKTQILAPAINWAGVFICYISPQTKTAIGLIGRLNMLQSRANALWAFGNMVKKNVIFPMP